MENDIIYCHDFADCCGCFYLNVEKPDVFICNECGFEITLKKLKENEIRRIVCPECKREYTTAFLWCPYCKDVRNKK